MKFHVMTLFPEMILQGLAPSIIGRAAQNNTISLHAVDMREYTQDKHGKVDDYPYGGGAGMLIQAQPVYDAHCAVSGGKKIRTVYMTPQGQPFTQKLAKELAKEEELIFLCGHYEGIDERVLEEIVTDYVSIGDYVLTGGELPAMVMIDAIARFVPGVLGNHTSAEDESFYNDLLEYPQYSRPEVWRGKEVPQVLLSGNHKKIREWRLQKSEERTKRIRPDLYAKYEEKQKVIKKLSKEKRNHIHLMESLKRGTGEILYREDASLLIYDADARTCMMLCPKEEKLADVLNRLPKDAALVAVMEPYTRDALLEMGYHVTEECYQYLYTSKETLPVRYKDIRLLEAALLSDADLAFLESHYDPEYIKERLAAGVLYGAFAEGKLVGFIGIHSEGSAGLLYVDNAYRGQGIGRSLEAYLMNRHLEKGWVPYGHVTTQNADSVGLQESMGLYRADKKLWWLAR